MTGTEVQRMKIVTDAHGKFLLKFCILFVTIGSIFSITYQYKYEDEAQKEIQNSS